MNTYWVVTENYIEDVAEVGRRNFEFNRRKD